MRMVALAEALEVLFPAAVPLVDYEVSDDGTGPRITRWSDALGARPTADQVAAVTADQVAAARTAKLRAAAGSLLTTAAEPVHVSIRAADTAEWTFGRNEVAECLWAALTLVCDRANVAVPTAAEIADRITTLRAGSEPGVPAADVADRGRRRLTQAEVLALIGATVRAGGGDPLG
jgi:hypothetical protein